MSEITRQVKVFEVNYSCSECEYSSFMVPTGNSFLTNPPQYEHRCPTCDNRTMLDTVYPYVKYEDVV